MRRPEDEIQKSCVKWLRVQHPKIAYFHAPLEGKRSPQYWNYLKSMGTSKGFPDFAIFNPSGDYHGLAVEFKKAGERPGSDQFDWLQRLSGCGWKIAVCYSLDEFMKVVNHYIGGK